MELYKSKFLTITKKNNTLVQEWSNQKLSPSIFKKEILKFLYYYDLHKPISILWIQHDFNLKINTDHITWLDTNILKCVHQIGIRKIAITIAKDEEVHLALVKSLNNTNAFIQPLYFNDIFSAKSFLKSGDCDELYDPSTINYNVVGNGTNHSILLNVGFNDLAPTLESINLLKKYKSFAQDNKIKFEQLTGKELEVFRLIVLGNTNKIIASMLFIEVSTVSTHRKHILKKLEVNTFKYLYKYAKAYRIVKF